MRLDTFHLPPKPFRPNRLSLGLLAVFAHLGVQAQIAVKDGSSVSRSDAVVNSTPRLGDDTGI